MTQASVRPCPLEKLRLGSHFCELVEKRVGCSGGRCRVLSGNQTAVCDSKALPIWSLLIETAHTFEFILNEERHNMGQLYSFLFTVGKPRHAFAFHERLAVVGHVVKYGRRMTNSCDRLAGIVERLDQRDGVWVIDKIPHRPVTADVENGVKIF